MSAAMRVESHTTLGEYFDIIADERWYSRLASQGRSFSHLSVIGILRWYHSVIVMTISTSLSAWISRQSTPRIEPSRYRGSATKICNGCWIIIERHFFAFRVADYSAATPGRMLPWKNRTMSMHNWSYVRIASMITKIGSPEKVTDERWYLGITSRDRFFSYS